MTAADLSEFVTDRLRHSEYAGLSKHYLCLLPAHCTSGLETSQKTSGEALHATWTLCCVLSSCGAPPVGI